jgi:hypothetical protein
MPIRFPTDEREPLTTFQYQPVPEGEGAGYFAKRYAGGPLMRFMEMSQQYLMAGLAYTNGRLNEDWNALTPIGRVLYPGRYGRVTEEAVTGTNNFGVNLAVGILADPLNFVALGAFTKLGKASRAIRGLESIASSQRTALSNLQRFRRIGKMTGEAFEISQTNPVRQYLKMSRTPKMLRDRIKELGVASDRLDLYEPLVKDFAKRGAKALDEATTLSSRLRGGQAALLGTGWTTGYGGVGKDVLRAATPKAADIIETVERGWHNTIFGKIKKYRLPFKPRVLQKGTQGLELASREDAHKVVQRIQSATKADTYKQAARIKDDIDSLIFDIDEAGAGRFSARDVMAKVENKDIFFGADDDLVTSFADGIRDRLSRWSMNERQFRRFGMLGEEYMTRVPTLNAQGNSLMMGFFMRKAGQIEAITKRLGMWSDYKALGGGNPFLQTTNLSQYARSKELPTYFKNMKDFSLQAAHELAGEEAVEAIKIAEFFGRAEELYKIERELGPLGFNQEFRRIFSDDVGEFLASKDNLRNWKIPNANEFNVYNENLGQVLAERGRRHAETIATGTNIKKFFSEFGIQRKAYKAGADIVEEINEIKKVLAERLPELDMERYSLYDEASIKNLQDSIKAERVTPVRKELAKARRLLKKARDKGVWIDSSEYIGAKEAAARFGKNLVPVKSGLKNKLGVSDDVINDILGKTANNVYMDEQALDVFAEVMNAWTRVERDGFLAQKWDAVQNWWARSTLFGGRASYLFNNLVGDRWNMMLAGAGPRYMMGTPGLQLMLPEGRGFQGLKGLVGVSDDTVLITSKTTGKQYTKREIVDWITGLDVDGGLFESEVFAAGQAAKIAEKEAKGVRELLPSVESFKRGDIVPFSREAAKFIEKNGRYNLFMHFLEDGRSPIEAAEGVWKYLFDYTKQNKTARRIAPFYFWTANNFPLQFGNFMKQPAKQILPYKIQKEAAIQGGLFGTGEDPTEMQKPEYLQASGVYLGEFKTKDGKPIDIYFDLNNIPPYAAQDIAGLLSSGGMSGAIDDMLRNVGGMISPVMQITFEQIANKDFFTGRAITGGGAAPMPERGITEFMGMNIEGMPEVQRVVHGVETAVTPLQLIGSGRKFLQEAPPLASLSKFILGAPVRKANKLSAEWINLAKERNKLTTQRNHYKAVKNYTKERELTVEISKINRKLSRISKQLQSQKKRYEGR